MHAPRISRTGSVGALTALVLVLTLGMAAAPLPAEEDLPLRFTAVAANLGARGPRGQVRVDINIDRWSSEEERAVLMEAMKESTSRSFADALRRQDRVGRLREVQGLGHDLRYARVTPLEDGGRQIILATDRPIAFVEAARSTRSRDSNVTLIQMTLDAEGNGSGQMMLGAEFSWDEEKNQLTIENFSSEPVRLNSIRLR
jgi:hypothetical protein